MTGSGVTEASMPGRCAAPPAPAMITRSPRLAADEPYSIMYRGIRRAVTTSASYGTANSARPPAAARMTGQSESLPMTMPTTAGGGVVTGGEVAAEGGVAGEGGGVGGGGGLTRRPP